MNREKKIKLMVIIPTLECGGSERYVSQLCNHLDVEKFDLTLVVLDNSHPFYHINAHRLELVDLGVKRVRHSLFAIRKIVTQKQPDIIYSTANHLNLMLATFRWMFPKKIRFIARESSIVSINSKRTPYPGIYQQLIRRFYPRFDRVICQSAWMQKDLVDHYRFPLEKTIVIPNMVEPRESATIMKETKKTVHRFITVARLSEEKGLDRLVRSVAALDIPFEYHIIGEGNERMRLEKLVADLGMKQKIFLEGEKIDPFRHVADADLFLMGSHYEGFPNALVEAGMYGIPAVAFDAPGGIGEIIRDGGNGYLVRDGDEGAFRDAIRKALVTNFNRERIQAETGERFSVQKLLPLVEELMFTITK